MEMIRKATSTNCVLLCSSAHVGQLTLYLSSWYASLKNALILFILFS